MNMLKNLSNQELMQYHRLYSDMMDGGNRRENTKIHGMDLKFAYHVVRLLNEVEQIMVEGDLDLMRNREQLKEIRAGVWSEEQLETYFAQKEVALEETYAKSTLRWGPDETAIKELLLNVLEEHYGSLDKCVVKQDAVVNALRRIISASDEARRVLEQVGALDGPETVEEVS